MASVGNAWRAAPTMPGTTKPRPIGSTYESYARRPAEAAPAAAPAADEDTPAEPAPASPNGVAGQRSALPARA